MLLVEQLRRMSSEERLLEDAAAYDYTATSWGTLHDYGTITLPVAGFLVFKYTWAVEAFTGQQGNHRLKIGGMYVSGRAASENSSGTVIGMVYLDSGSYSG